MFNKVLEKFKIVSKKPTANETIENALKGIFGTTEGQLSSTKEEREKFKKDWETFKKKSSEDKELREQLEFVEELKKIPVEKPVKISERLPIREWVRQYKNPTRYRKSQKDTKLVPKNLTKFPHYFAKVPHFTHIDIYMLSEMFKLNSYQHHGVKKLIAAGNRGSKDRVKDLQEVINTVEAWIEVIKSEEKV